MQYTPVPVVCSGIIRQSIDDETSMYETFIIKSPLGEFNGPIFCSSCYSPTTDNNYRAGDKVKVLITIMLSGLTKFILWMCRYCTFFFIWIT